MSSKALVFLTLAFAATSLQAQTTAGTVAGAVSDSSGARISGASIILTNNKTQETRTSTSSASGDYVFANVAAGDYTMDAQASGFKREHRSAIHLDANQNARVDFALQIGQVSETIDVKSDAQQVDTRAVQLGATIDTRRVQDLPLNGRNVYDLMTLMPGVTNVSTSLTGTNDSNNMNVNGQRVRSNNFYMDGAFNNSLFRNGGNQAPNPDAVQEFHLITSNFDAEYGRLPGSVMNVVTRSGGNAFHGTAFEFLRNDSVNARNFFQASVTPLHWNQFGGTLGGPIRRDKTFFFGSYQGFRESTSSFVNNINVPTAAQRAGDFSALAPAKWPLDPLTGKAFPGGIIPTSRLDPVAQNILKMMVPLPNNANGTYSVTSSAPVTDDQGIARIDHQLTAFNKLSGTLFLDRSVTLLPFQGGSQLANWGTSNADYSQNNVVISDDWILSPNIINQGRFSYTLNRYITGALVHTTWPDFGSKIALGATPPRPPQLFVNGFWQAGTLGDDDMPQRTFGASDMVSWIHGKHAMKFGGNLLWNHFVEDGNWLGAGQVRFSGAYTGYAPADFELGQAASFRQNNGLARDFRSVKPSLFFQDDWKATRKLTLNLGLRWEINPAFTSAGDALATFAFGAKSTRFPTAPTGLLFPGDPGISAGVIPTRLNNFAPRVGMAYDVFGNGRTAVRAGWGLFYAVGMTNITSNLQNQPFLVDLTIFGTPNLVDPWAANGGSPYPYTFNPEKPIFTLPLTADSVGGYKTPYVEQYNFSVQQQIGDSMNFQVSYVGSSSRHLFLQRDINAPVYGPGANANNVNNRRPYMPGTFGAVYQLETAANASYNSLQASFTRRFAKGFSLQANYTFSKSIDILSDDPTGPASVTFVNSNNVALDRGVSNFNVPHVVQLSWIWQAPEFRHWGWVGRQALGGWQLNGIMVGRSGNPVNVTSGTDTNLDGNNNDRPNLVGNPSLSGDRSRAELINQYFNTAAFGRVVPGQIYGTVGRNLLQGPASINWNMSAFKQFSIYEKARLQFRADFFNVFNQVNLGNPNGTLSAANFGKITSAAAPRILQFGLKFLF